ncbi:MAG: TatD family hydrolase [Pseudomonadales bacterium]
MSKTNLIDIGANLTHRSFDADLEDVLARAHVAGVKRVVVTGTDEQCSEAALELARGYPGVLYATAGVHPHEAKTFSNTTRTTLKAIAEHAAVVAVGETGLDFNRNYSPAGSQQDAFEQQLELAAELQLPVFVHERDAHQRLHEMLKDYRDQLVDVVVHCFTGVKTELHSYLDLDLHIGITGWICDERRGKHLHDLVADIPANRLMLETDAPYLLPRDYPEKSSLQSARRNEPCTLRHIAETVAGLRGVELETLAAQTSQTAQAFFRID